MCKKYKCIVAVVCSVVLLTGTLLTNSSLIAKATNEKATSVSGKEWSVISTDTKVGNDNQTISRSNLGIALLKEGEADTTELRGKFALCINVNLADETAIATFKKCTVELAKATCDHYEINWALNNTYLVQGENSVVLQFSEAVGQGETLNLADGIGFFRIYHPTTTADWSGITIQQVKILDTTPVISAFENGATAAVAPAESDIPEGYVFGGWYTDEACTKVLSGTTTGTAYAKFVNAKVLEVKAQYASYSNEPGVIADCDSNRNLSLGSLTTEENMVKVGTGAIKRTGSSDHHRLTMVWEEGDSVDISNYKRIHFWFYINSLDEAYIGKATSLIFEMGSDRKCDNSSLKLFKNLNELQTGWNEIELIIKGTPATPKTDTSPAFDLANINYVRIYTNQTTSEGLVTCVDDIRATDEKEVAGRMLDCDTAITIGTLTTADSDIKEGTGALTGSNSYGAVRFQGAIPETDISGYDEIQFWLYVGDTTSVTGSLYFEINSGGKQDDKNERQYAFPMSALKPNAWNLVSFDILEVLPTGTCDLTKINYFRMHTGYAGSMVIRLDDMRAVNRESGVVHDFENARAGVTIDVGTRTSNPAECAEGLRAYKAEGSGQFRFRMSCKAGSEINIAGYQKLKFSFFYNSDEYKSGNFVFGIGSGGTNDKNERTYTLTNLQAGQWNEVELDIPTSSSVAWDSINYVRVFTTQNANNAGLVTMIDNIRAVNEQEGVFFADCEAALTDFISNSNSAGVSGEEKTDVKEGKVAYISQSVSFIRFQFTRKHAVDASAYRDGMLHFWLYVGDKAKFENNNLVVEISSSGQADVEELSWILRLGDLQENEWNLVTLDLTSGAPCGGQIDMSKINYFRMYLSSAKNVSETATLKIDDIRFVQKSYQSADIRFVTTVDSKYYRNVGFDITVGSKTLSKESTTVYSKLYATGSNSKTITYVPTTFAPQSKYFSAYVVQGIPFADYSRVITVKPYWTTQDGTKVYGTEKTYSINAMLSVAGK